MAGPLIPLVLAAAGIKLAAWKYGTKLLQTFQEEQAAHILSELDLSRLKLFEAPELKSKLEAGGDVYTITCDGEDEFKTAFNTCMRFAVQDVPNGKPILICSLTRLNGEVSYREMSPKGRRTLAFWTFFDAVRRLLGEMRSARPEAAPSKACETEEPAPVEPAMTSEAASSAKNTVKVTPAQLDVLKAAAQTPGQVLEGQPAVSIAACFRKGWIKSKEARPDPLSGAPWTLTDKGASALAGALPGGRA